MLKHFATDILTCYHWKHLRWQILAVALTYVSVMSGFDWYYYTLTRDATLQMWLFPAAMLGGFLPIFIPGVLFFLGRAERNVRATRTALAVSQAAATGLLISSFYKIFTGRIPPPFDSGSLVDISHQFNFGIYRYGMFWGWPSSHTTVAFAIAVTLFVLYRKNPLIKYSALLVAFYIGISVSTNIHWFSEFITGAILGSVIGVVIGKSRAAHPLV